MLERCKLFEMNEKLLQECNGFSLLFDTDEDEWLSLHGSQSINEDGSIPKIRTRLIYFNLMVLKKGML